MMQQFFSSLAVGVGFAAMLGFLTLFGRSFGAVAPPPKDFRVAVVEAVLVGEAGGEGSAGIAAVAEVIRNRMERSGKSAYEVVTQPKQFSCLNNTTPEKLVRRHAHVNNQQAYMCARLLIHDPFNAAISDTVKGATHFHAVEVFPVWANPTKRTAVIRHHIFYRL